MRIAARFKQILLVIPLACTLPACSGVLDSLKEESEEAAKEAEREDRFSAEKRGDRRQRYRGLSANTVDVYGPQVRRARERARSAADEWDDESQEVVNEVRGEVSEARRRYTKADFIDNSPADNSLWNGQGQGNFYFSRNNRFESGDLVVVTVDRALRREIQYALWKSLPAEQRRIRRKPAAEENKEGNNKTATDKATVQAAANARPTEAEEKAAAEEAAKSSLGAGDKDSDLIRMEIIENLGNGLVRLQGQKRVIYRGRPKFVEVSGLVRGKDIDDQARANSKSFLDMRSRVVE